MMPDEEPHGVWKSEPPDKTAKAAHLKISVLQGPREQLAAMATVDMDDLRSLVRNVKLEQKLWKCLADQDRCNYTDSKLTANKNGCWAVITDWVNLTLNFSYMLQDLPVFFLPPPPSDDPLAVYAATESTGTVHSPSQESLHSTASSVSEANSVNEHNKVFDPSNRVADLDPVKFPLYSVHAAPGDAVHLPSGQLPMVGFWVKRPRPLTFNRATGWLIKVCTCKYIGLYTCSKSVI